MLSQLTIRNILLIEALTLDFSPGLNVLTGETGAGKSILLDSLSLALGARADASLVRTGAPFAQVSAQFEVPAQHPAFEMLRGQGLETQDEMLVLRRHIKPDGGSRAFINDQPVGVALLREVGALLLELHGQNDESSLLNPKGHRELLDRYGKTQVSAQAVREAWQAWQQAQSALAALEKEQTQLLSEQAFIADACETLAKLAPKAGEEAALAQARLTLQRNERAVEDVAAVQEHLSGSQGAVARLRQAARRLERASTANPDLAALLTHLDRSIEHASEAEAQLERLSAHMAADPAKLEAIEARLFDLRALARKYRCEVDALPALHAQFITQAQNIANLEDERLAAQKQVVAARESYGALAQKLYHAHQEAARALAHAVSAELAPLKLEKAQFQVSLTLLEEAGWSSAGVHRVSFEIATNPGAAFGPLNKIASGGELARFTLALKVALAQANSASTLIFDEVDRGVGGAVAAAIGERLKRLASHAQILLVTHSPQVAAAGSAHYRIEKQTSVRGTHTHVSVLDQSARRHEIARMLSGDTITPEALAQADRLLVSAQ